MVSTTCRIRFSPKSIMRLLRYSHVQPSAFRPRTVRYFCSAIDNEKEHFVKPQSGRLPGISRRVELVESENDWNRIYPDLASELERFPALGFDCEWPPFLNMPTEQPSVEYTELRSGTKKRTKVTLAQLATRDGTVVLIRIDRMDSMPDSLRNVFADPAYLKTGVEATLDAHYLLADYPHFFERIAGALDVRYLLYPSLDTRYRRAKLCRMQASLNALCSEYLQIDCKKNKDVVVSDWSAPTLSPEQIDYAAADAQLSLDVFVALLQHIGFVVDQNDWKDIYDYCTPYFDQRFASRVSIPPPQFFPRPIHATPPDDRKQEIVADTTSNDETAISDKTLR